MKTQVADQSVSVPVILKGRTEAVKSFRRISIIAFTRVDLE